MITLGPVHSMLEGLFKLNIEVDHDICTKIHVTSGYQHRSFEKHAVQMDYQQVIPYIDRLDYLAACNNELPFVLASEKLMGLTIPKRAQQIRTILCELNRMASHLYFLSVMGQNLSYPIIFSKSLHVRESILDLMEMITGARLLYNYFCVGGVSQDLTIGMEEEIKSLLPKIKSQMSELSQLLLLNPLVIKRTTHVGVISQKLAQDCHLSGPNFIASSIPHSEIGTPGDIWNRIHVRMNQIEKSIITIEQVLEKMTTGPHTIPLTHIAPPKGTIYMESENPRGRLGFHLVSDGTDKPHTLNVKAPSADILSSLPKLCVGVHISDLNLFLASLDISISEADL